MKKIFSILPVFACLFLVVNNSCTNYDDDIINYDFGYIKIINNSNNIYGIQIDSSYSYYCNEVRPKRSITCDLKVGWHNIQVDSVYNNNVYISLGEFTIITIGK